MSTATLEPKPAAPPAPAQPRASEAICDALVAQLGECRTRAELYRTALELLARHFDSPYAAIHIESRAGTIEDQWSPDKEVASRWGKQCSGLLFQAQYQRCPRARMLESVSTGWQFAAMAVPITEGSEGLVGAIALVIRCSEKRLAEARLSELRALVALVGMMASAKSAPPRTSAATNSPADTTGASKVAGYSSLHEFAFAIVNNLKGKLGCEQVCLGLANRGKVKMLCMSGFDNLYPRSPGAKLIEQAMEECLDAEAPICFQGDQKWSENRGATGHRLHQKWSASTGGAAVASIPLMKDDECIAVLSIRHTPQGRFDDAQLEKIGQMVSPLAPGILLLMQANQSLAQHAARAAGRFMSATLSRGAWGRKAVAFGMILAIGWMAFGSRDYIVSVPAEIIPGDVRHIAAPFEGTIQSVFFEPGDSVEAGSLLVQMDTRDLIAERKRLLAEKQIALLEIDQATAEKDLAAAAQANARVAIAESQLAVVQHKLEQAEIRAPAAGRILMGDLAPRVGEVMPMGEPLCEFAPDTNWKTTLCVPEQLAPLVQASQPGEFTTHAQPDDVESIVLDQVHSSAEVVDGKNVFKVEAEFQGQPPGWVRAGMKGVARINVGRKPEWYIWFHRPIDSLRLLFWRL